MRRLLTIAALTGVILTVAASPALAQSSGTSGSRSVLVLLGAIGAGVALFLLIIILFSPNTSIERDLKGRLGAYTGDSEDRGRLSRIPLLRRFVSGAEDIARDRGFINQIETALDQANMPLRPGEAIAGIIGLAAIAGLLAMVVQQSPIWCKASHPVTRLSSRTNCRTRSTCSRPRCGRVTRFSRQLKRWPLRRRSQLLASSVVQ